MLITTEGQLNNLFEKLTPARYLAFDTETTGLSPYTGDRIIGLSFGIPKDGQVETFYVPFRHERGHRLNFPQAYLKKQFAALFAQEDRTWVGWNSKFDLHMLNVDGIEVNGKVLDAMLAWHLCDENLHSYGLKELAKSKLGAGEVQDDKDLQTLLKSEKLNKAAMKELSPIEAAPYAESDASLTWRLFRMAYQQLQKDGLVDLFYEVCRYARVLEKCERKGIKIDPVKCEELIETAQSRDAELLAVLKQLAGADFNPNSSAQCRKWLNLPSSAKEFLEEIQNNVEGVAELLEYRGHAKALNGFYIPFRSRRDRFNRVHASFRLHGTVAGRLSCSEPNLQNIPRTSSQWARVKQMIVAGSGCKLLSTDLSQAEFRLMAHYVQDANLIRAYCEGGADMHQFIADELGIDRHSAKTLNFLVIYGGGPEVAARQIGCSLERAKEFLSRYHRRIPGLKRYSYALQREAESRGYVSLWTGRRRRFPYVNGVRFKTHTAMNNVIQGGVAEIVRVAMCRIDEQLPEDAWMLGQVHDEVLVECKSKLVPEAARIVKEALENAAAFRVPIIADQKIGNSWGEMEAYNA